MGLFGIGRKPSARGAGGSSEASSPTQSPWSKKETQAALQEIVGSRSSSMSDADWSGALRLAQGISARPKVKDAAEELIEGLKVYIKEGSADAQIKALIVLDTCARNCPREFGSRLAHKGHRERLEKAATGSASRQVPAAVAQCLVNWARLYDEHARDFMASAELLASKNVTAIPSVCEDPPVPQDGGVRGIDLFSAPLLPNTPPPPRVGSRGLVPSSPSAGGATTRADLLREMDAAGGAAQSGGGSSGQPSPAAPPGGLVDQVPHILADVSELEDLLESIQRGSATGKGSRPETMENAYVSVNKCTGWGEQIMVDLAGDNIPEEALSSLLSANDHIQEALEKWNNLVHLGVVSLEGQGPARGGGDLDASWVELERGGGRAPGDDPRVKEQLEAMRLEMFKMQGLMNDAAQRQALEFKDYQDHHQLEMQGVKQQALTKLRELMARVQELEEVKASLEGQLGQYGRDLEDAQEQGAAAAQRAAAAAAEAARSSGPDPRAVEKSVAAANQAAEQRHAALEARLQKEKSALAAEKEKVAAELHAARSQVNDLSMRVLDMEGELAAARSREESATMQAESLRQAAEGAAGAMARAEEAERRMQSMALELKKESILRKKAYNEIREIKGNVRVLCRVRPAGVGSGENQAGLATALTTSDEFTVVIEAEGAKGEVTARKFEYDACFPEATSQQEVFEETRVLIQSALDGYNVCVFCYGQTGSGKTHTMLGSGEEPGILPRAMEEIFRSSSATVQVSVECYMLELYQDVLVDLLSPQTSKGNLDQKLEIKRDAAGGVRVEGAVVVPAPTLQDLQKIFQQGAGRRRVAATKMNSSSSRSHLVFAMVLTRTDTRTRTTTRSKMTFVDLAGSERVAKSGAVHDKTRMDEARAINKSLSALGDVVMALTKGEGFVPYRNHKLTMLMSDSLGGNAKSLMVVNVSPLTSDAPESKNSLEYAARVKLVTNDASKSVETQEILRLKGLLEKQKKEIDELSRSGGGRQ